MRLLCELRKHSSCGGRRISDSDPNIKWFCEASSCGGFNTSICMENEVLAFHGGLATTSKVDTEFYLLCAALP